MKKKICDLNYEIYDNGDVINLKTGKKLKGSISEHGYLYYRLSKDNKKSLFYAHRLVAEYFIDNPNNYPVVNHKDGDKLNNNVTNLEWASYSENTTHAHKNNLIKPVREREYYTEDLPEEIWKKIPDYHYSVSSLGRVRNDDTLLLLKPSLTCGYYKVRLSKDGKTTDWLIHRLVYSVFSEIDILPKEKVVDHIDGNKLNNSYKNLRLTTLSENVNSALYNTKTNSSCKKVEQLTLTDEHIKYFDSAAQAARELKLDSSTISKVCRGVNKSHGGFHFRYIE